MNHEKRLDELVARLELLVDQLDVEGLVPEAGLGGDTAKEKDREKGDR